jgi:hypothetical protein
MNQIQKIVAWFGEVITARYNLNPLFEYNVDQRLSYYATPIIIGLLLRKRK